MMLSGSFVYVLIYAKSWETNKKNIDSEGTS
jgi:hypothetical protein